MKCAQCHKETPAEDIFDGICLACINAELDATADIHRDELMPELPFGDSDE